MRIIYFVDGFRSGGKERRCIELLKSLKNNPDFEIHVVSLRSEIVYPEFYTLDYPYHLIEKDHAGLSVFTKFYKLCKEIKPDIVHCWSSMNASYAIYAKIRSGFKLVNSQITDAPLQMNWISKYGIQARLNFLFSDMILANSKAGLRSYRAPVMKSTYIHNGFDVNRIKTLGSEEDIRKEFGIKTKYIVTMVGAFAERKDYETYLKVAKDICDLRNDVSFLGIGEGKNLEKYRSETSSYDHIVLPGRCENVESIINASDICVLMTNGSLHGEGISNSILEYMVIGKPVIASDSGGTSEIIDHNTSGFVIEDKAGSDLKRHILGLLDDNKLRLKMGIEGKKRIGEHFNMKKMTDGFINIYLNS